MLETEFEGKATKHTMLQLWPVRAPRPTGEKLQADFPLLTGQRVLDSLFPFVISSTSLVACTLTCASPAAFKEERLPSPELSVAARCFDALKRWRCVELTTLLLLFFQDCHLAGRVQVLQL